MFRNIFTNRMLPSLDHISNSTDIGPMNYAIKESMNSWEKSRIYVHQIDSWRFFPSYVNAWNINEIKELKIKMWVLLKILVLKYWGGFVTVSRRKCTKIKHVFGNEWRFFCCIQYMNSESPRPYCYGWVSLIHFLLQKSVHSQYVRCVFIFSLVR